MNIIKWFQSKFPKEHTLTLEELKEELKITEYQINAGIAIAKANPDHPELWESVWFRVDEQKRLKEQIKKMEG